MISEARRRAAKPLENPVRYMTSWAEGDLADVVKAVLDQADAGQEPPGARHTGRDRSAAEAVAAATPQEPPPAHSWGRGSQDATVTPMKTAMPECPHGHPGGVYPRPGDELPACGPCRAHTIACSRPESTCGTCQAIADARPAHRDRRPA